MEERGGGPGAGRFALGFAALAVVIAAVFFLAAGHSGSIAPADIVLPQAGRDGQVEYEGTRVIDDDDGIPTQPPQLEGKGLSDRYVAITSARDEAITIALDPSAIRDADQRNASVRIGFLAGATARTYPRRVTPSLSATIPPRASGLLVLRTRIRACSDPSNDHEPVGGGIRVTAGPGAPRALRVRSAGEDTVQPAAASPLGERLQVLVPACPGG